MIPEGVKGRMDTLKGTSARIVLIAYYQAQLVERQAGLMSCTKETFEVQKGRCLELQHMLQYLESK